MQQKNYTKYRKSGGKYKDKKAGHTCHQKRNRRITAKTVKRAGTDERKDH
ncbi:uncharacterized protein G2W53_039641 [Senna tora]|uniref:Uncharacterized protein n=1 Tax=Senna tora TaxID=362788 RepID=A0A834SR86_9FABA|nr:uncharacterized protein G2W53_039641 [Senna tora]